jgi:hypothetical protein
MRSERERTREKRERRRERGEKGGRSRSERDTRYEIREGERSVCVWGECIMNLQSGCTRLRLKEGEHHGRESFVPVVGHSSSNHRAAFSEGLVVPLGCSVHMLGGERQIGPK